MGEALRESIAELEATFTCPPDEPTLRESLHGFWKLLFTSDATRAAAGLSGCGAPSHKALLSQYQCFTTPKAGSLAPSMQTIEVVGDSIVGRSAISALKGDFAITDSAGGKVHEVYKRREYDGAMEYDALPNPHWSTTYLSPSMRVSKEEGGAVCVFAKASAEEAQEEIGRLLEASFGSDGSVADSEGEDGGEGDDLEDDRPLWQRRLDDENGIKRTKNGTPINEWGPPTDDEGRS